ncbi:MAG TPA: hypothetical protein VGZ73_11665 [Bryobacteraceae bacterium]|nr:hypothetical protein [Bryobacteraceae bacterium]
MLLVTFHGGASAGINNVFAYDTTTGALLNATALAVPNGGLSELRSMVLANGNLYVANGAKSISTVLCYQVPSSGSAFTLLSTVIGPTVSKKGNFENSIAHPFGIAFNGTDTCYVSNQDTNVVAQVNLSSNGQAGTLGQGCQSAYLNKLFPSPSVFLDGTYVASQIGALHGVDVSATPVPLVNGGLNATGVMDKGLLKVQNSVRDVAVANGILFVCDEPDSLVNLYSLADGTFLGSSNKLSDKPTHLEIQNGGLYVSAGSLLYWGQLPAKVSGASLSLSQIALTPPTGNKIGGISFDNGTSTVTVYVPFQEGTHAAVGGSIFTFTVTQSSASTLPVFSNGTQFVASGPSTFSDTPEFVLYLSI